MPEPDNAIYRLMQATTKVSQISFPVRSHSSVMESPMMAARKWPTCMGFATFAPPASSKLNGRDTIVQFAAPVSLRSAVASLSPVIDHTRMAPVVAVPAELGGLTRDQAEAEIATAEALVPAPFTARTQT